MRKTILWSTLLTLTILLSACSSNGMYRVTLITEGTHTIAGDVAGDMILLGGQAYLAAGAKLDGNIHILSGSLEQDGLVLGDVSYLNGALVLGPTAQIDGTLNLGGDSYTIAPTAVINGGTNSGTGIAIPDLPERTAPNFWIRLLRSGVSGFLLGMAAVILVRFVPNGVNRVGDAALHHGWVSAAMGLLVGLVGVSLFVTMAYTILLIPVTLLGIAIMGMGVLYGWIGLGVSTGRISAHAMKRKVSLAKMAFTGTLFFVVAMQLLTSIPVIGGLLGLTLAAIGLGAVSITRFGLTHFTPANPED